MIMDVAVCTHRQLTQSDRHTHTQCTVYSYMHTVPPNRPHHWVYECNWLLQQHTPTHEDRSRRHLLIFSSAWENGKQHSWPMAPPSLSSCSPLPDVTPLFPLPLVLRQTDASSSPVSSHSLSPCLPFCVTEGQTDPVRMEATKKKKRTQPLFPPCSPKKTEQVSRRWKKWASGSLLSLYFALTQGGGVCVSEREGGRVGAGGRKRERENGRAGVCV